MSNRLRRREKTRSNPGRRSASSPTARPATARQSAPAPKEVRGKLSWILAILGALVLLAVLVAFSSVWLMLRHR